MILKIMSLFLIGMVVLAMFGRLRVPDFRSLGRKKLSSGQCRSCKAPLIGKTPCPCGRSGHGGSRGD